MRYVGIDYSMTCPAMCVWNDTGDPFQWDDCSAYFLSDIKKDHGIRRNVIGVDHLEWSTQEERFDQISDFFVNLLEPTDLVLIEGYAFGAKGQVFNIGEHTGLLKHKLWRLGCEIIIAPPSTIKKHATGRGNANKSEMLDAFAAKTKVDLRELLELTGKRESPAADVCDAFWACSLATKNKS